MERKIISAEKGAEILFHNNVDFCVGTGRMGLAMTQEYQEQLGLVQEEIGFRHIRGHGLFCDDMAIYQQYEENGEIKAEYNFLYLDRVMDSYLRLGIRPFLELGFMPEKMASGTQTVFYWKGNVTPPKSYAQWTDMVQALLLHLMDRYGADEVVQWPVEVWNEPNLAIFWEKSDMPEYFKLFSETFKAVKAVDVRFKVGGPAVCGGTDEIWIQAFMEYCSQNRIPVDFVSRHHYTIESPEKIGHYAYPELMNPEDGLANLQTTREIIDRYPEYKGLPIHVTEFNTSYNPQSPLHDTNQNAAYIAHQLSRLGDCNESYSYWTFGDVFEELGVPFTPFHGGFGLVANGCIPKPTFWTFAFYKKLQKSGGKCVFRDDNVVILQTQDGSYLGIAWNMTLKRNGQDLLLEMRLPADVETYSLFLQTVDEEHCNPLKLWHDMGEPKHISEEQKKTLKAGARPFIQSKRIQTEDAHIAFELLLKENAVTYFEVKPVEILSDRGYDYKRVMQDA